MNKKGMHYTRTSKQRKEVQEMFKEMKPSSTRAEILNKLNIKKKAGKTE